MQTLKCYLITLEMTRHDLKTQLAEDTIRYHIQSKI